MFGPPKKFVQKASCHRRAANLCTRTMCYKAVSCHVLLIFFFSYIFLGFFVYMYLCRPSEASTWYCVIPGGYPPQDWQSLPCAGEELDSNPGLLICSQVRYHWATSPPLLLIWVSGPTHRILRDLIRKGYMLPSKNNTREPVLKKVWPAVGDNIQRKILFSFGDFLWRRHVALPYKIILIFFGPAPLNTLCKYTAWDRERDIEKEREREEGEWDVQKEKERDRERERERV
jgi:hypothetical protein